MILSVRLSKWDRVVRLIHWAQVVCVSGCLGTAYLLPEWLSNSPYYWHQWFGVGVLVLVALRIAWGFVATGNAKFKQFVPTMSRIRQYLKEPETFEGHTPQAALAVFTMWALLLTQSISGLFAIEEDSEFYAPLSEFIKETTQMEITAFHLVNIQLLLVMLSLHVCAIIFYEAILNKRIIKTMINGSISKQVARKDR